MKNPGEK
jgi:hypothetical protein